MLTDKDLEELRQERHDDYVAEARRELEAAWDGEPRLEAWLESLQESADRCSKPLQAAELDQGVVLPCGAQGGVVGHICHQAQTTGSAGLNFCDAGDELLIVYAADFSAQGGPLRFAGAVLFGFDAGLHQQCQSSAQGECKARCNHQRWIALQSRQSSGRAANELHQIEQHVEVVVGTFIDQVEPVAVIHFVDLVFTHGGLLRCGVVEAAAAAWVDLGLGCAQALFPWDSRMAKDCDVGIRNVSHFGSPANMRGRGWPLLCGASLAPVSLEVA